MAMWKTTDLVASSPKFGAQLVSSGSNKANIASNTTALYQNTTPNSFNYSNAANNTNQSSLGMFAVSAAERANGSGEGHKVKHQGWNLRKVWQGPVTSITITAGGSGYANSGVGKFYGGAGLVNCHYHVTTNSSGGITAISLDKPGRLSNAASISGNVLPANAISAITVSTNGAGYTNGDVLLISNGTINASFTLTTNGTGGANLATLVPGLAGAGFVAVTPAFTVSSLPYLTINTVSIGAPGKLYTNTDTVTFTGGNCFYPAVGNIVTNIIGGLVSITLSNTGLGYDGILQHVNAIFSNSTGGASKGINAGFGLNFTSVSGMPTGNGVSAITVTANGSGYNNGDIVVVSNGTISAIGLVTTNGAAGMNTVTIVSGGKGFGGASNVVIKVYNAGNGATGNGVTSFTVSAGGTGYNNTDVITVSNGVVNATANPSTNSTGGIGSVTVLTHGSGFTGATNAAISFANSTGGPTTGTGATLVVVESSATITATVSSATFSATIAGGTGATLTPVLGGRANRIHYETIVASSNMASSNGTGSTIFPH